MSEERMKIMFSKLEDLFEEKINELEKRFEERINGLEKSFEERISELEKSFEERFDKHEEQQRIDFERINKRFDTLEERFDKHEDKQRLDLAKLEYDLWDKTSALFDARESNIEKIKKSKSRISSIEAILEEHNYRILNLESKAN